jgi:hypothetical protein
MARADLLLDLVEAERRGDRERFRVSSRPSSPRSEASSTI